MAKVKFPSIKALGKELSGIRQNVEFTTDVYLVVYDNGQWAVTFEMPRSVTTVVVAWARYFLPGYRTPGWFNGREVAKDMIHAARLDIAEHTPLRPFFLSPPPRPSRGERG